MTVKKLVQHLNSLKIQQTSEWTEDIPDDIWNEYFQGKIKVLERNMNVDKHRWYELSDEAIEILDGIMIIESVTDTVGEMQMIEDCNHILRFYEGKEVNIISYKKI